MQTDTVKIGQILIKAFKKTKQDQLKLNKDETFSNGLAASLSFKRLLIINYSLSASMLIQIVLFHCYHEFRISGDTAASYYLYMGNVLAAVQIFLVILRHHAHNHLKKAYLEDALMHTTYDLVQKFCLLLLMPYPFLQGVTFSNFNYSNHMSDSYELNSMLILASMFRLGFCIFFFLQSSQYHSPRSHRICKLYGTYAGAMYCIRAQFEDKPFTFITSIFIGSIFIFTFAFRIGESNHCNLRPEDCYWNMFWLTVITMTTVGYGDFFPQTTMGRLIDCLCISWGVLIVSVMVVVLTNAFRMNRNQWSALDILKKLFTKKTLRTAAGEYICVALKNNWSRKKRQYKLIDYAKERKLKKRFIAALRMEKTPLQAQKDISFYNNMTWQFDRSFHNLQRLILNNLSLIDWMHSNFLERVDDFSGLSGIDQFLENKRRRVGFMKM